MYESVSPSKINYSIIILSAISECLIRVTVSAPQGGNLKNTVVLRQT